MWSHRFRLESFLVVCTAAFALACSPEIGDECSVSTDCSNSGDRLCDTTQPGGYCTIFNCEPGTCPEEAICIGYYTSDSKVCKDPQEEPRLMRTYCLRRCDGNGDCRSGYRCIDMNKNNPWGAEVVEYGPINGSVCVVPYSGAPLAENPNTEVCTGTDAGFDVPEWHPDAAGGDAGSDAGDAGSDANDAGSDASDAGSDAPADGDSDAADAGTDAADAGTDAADAGTDASTDA